MLSFIIWLVGVICCIWCIKDVWSKAKLDISTEIEIPICREQSH